MAKRITDLTALTSPAASTLVAGVDMTGAPVTRKITIAQLLGQQALNFIIGNGTTVISTGVKGVLEMPFAATILSVRLVAPKESGDLVVDIWRDSYFNFPPTVADSITAAAKPTLAAANKYQDTTLTGWTTSIAAGDYLTINVDSAATITIATLSLRLLRA
jgi:hypothetical protein